MRLKKIDPEEKLPIPLVQLRQFQAWAKGCADDYPTNPPARLGYDYWKIGVWQGLVDPPTARPMFQRACAQAMIEAARRLVAAKPSDDPEWRVFACLVTPGLFKSDINFFYDDETYRNYMGCEDWTPLPASRDLAAERGLRWPSHFQVQGYQAVYPAWEDQSEERSELWFVGELAVRS